MSLKYYGVYLAYAPTVELNHEGLGRYLAALIKGASQRSNIRFVLVCPSWSRDSLEKLFSAEAVPKSCFDLISPEGLPPALYGYQKWNKYKNRERKLSVVSRAINKVVSFNGVVTELTLHGLVRSKNIYMLPLALWPALGLTVSVVLLSPVWLPMVILYLVFLFFKNKLLRRVSIVRRAISRVSDLLSRPKDDGLVLRLFQDMEVLEAQRMQVIIDGLDHVRAWYCPTAFWPAFNKIKGPRLICVPDVVLKDFSIAYSQVGGDRFLRTFETINCVIEGGSNFVTYSEDVKWGTLVDHYGVSPECVDVIRHAPNDLSRWVEISGPDAVAGSSVYCKELFSSALKFSSNYSYVKSFLNLDVKYFFYASQSRPNKNIITLLRAYKYLLRNRLIGHKLILTGDINALPSVKKFVVKHSLQNDVLFLHGLSIKQLAACYKLADLAINPSLSEGGCPFTFTEALSVNTPVVMARIPVSEEVLIDPHLQNITFFDPYDWQDLARRIEWALANREELLAVQRKTYVELAQRTWGNVVDEHLHILDRIANGLEDRAVL